MTALTLATLAILGAGTYRISKLFIEDVIFEKIREKIFTKFSPETTKIGYLFTCYWCMSIWIGTLITLGYILSSTIIVLVCLPFALSAIAGLLSDVR
jgi:hypothetical protein